MHISRSMADRMGGRLAVLNRPGGGAEVTLDLPPDSWTPAAAEPEVALPDLSRVKVLVADDTPTSQSILTRMLTTMGAEVEIADDGVEAVHWLEREAFDIALVDIEMPGLSGIDVIRALRSSERPQARMPVIAVTAYALRANREAIYAAGADAVLAKPVADEESLGLAVAAALGRPPLTDAPDPMAARPGSGLSRFDRARFEHLLEIAGPDDSRELLSRLCNDLRTAERGLVAAISRGDMARIRAESHVLIALAGAVGADRLQAGAEAMNAAAHAGEPVTDAQCRNILEEVDWLIGTVEAERGRTGEPT
jgi:CheY-like chemotaxis protein